MIESVVRGSNAELIAHHVRPLWFPDEPSTLDPTYGKGGWWKVWRPERLVAHDKYQGPACDGVDYHALPEADGTFDLVAFDPPYCPPGGRKTSTVKGMHAAYGMDRMPANPTETAEDIAAGMKECVRVLAPRGILLVKCMDYITSGRFQQGLLGVLLTARDLGIDHVDQFVHAGTPGPQPTVNLDGSPRRQVHARNVHSYLCVFRNGR